MLKRAITYEDFNGDTVTETFYFHISETELVEMDVKHKEGFIAMINRIIETDDKQALIAQFKQLVLMAYGVKSDDGRRFIKTEQLRTEFTQTAAYNALFLELATNDDAAATFIKGVLPKNLVSESEKKPAVPNNS